MLIGFTAFEYQHSTIYLSEEFQVKRYSAFWLPSGKSVFNSACACAQPSIEHIMLSPKDLNGISNLIDPTTGPIVLDPSDYNIDHIDYAFIGSSTDSPYLKVLLGVLE